MNQYHNLIKDILVNGELHSDRTGVGTRSVFGRQLRFDLEKGFPLLTTKKMHFKGIAHELLWFMSGSTNTQYLKDNKVTIWDEWADENGDLGPIYGHQLRNFGGKHPRSNFDYGGVDQLKNVIESIKTNPSSRRHVMTLWNPIDLPYQALACCHGTVIQFYVSNNQLSCGMYQRSCDAFLGLPYNIASYALLLHMVSQVTSYTPKDLVITLGDTHLYTNHKDQSYELLKRDPEKYNLPSLILNPEIKDIDLFKYDDIKIVGYESYSAIKAEVAV